MRRLILLLTALLIMCLPALSETDMPGQPNPEGWQYVGYMPAGVTFLIPEDSVSLRLTAQEEAAGVLLLVMNDDYTLQLRRYTPEQMNMTAFRAMLDRTPSAQVEIREVDGVEIILYRNGRPTGVSELYGIALVGADGCLYKISIFTGLDEDCSEDAPVWAIAEQIGQSITLVDYSTWPVEN